MKPIVLHATRERPWPRTCVWNAAGWRPARAARTFLGGIRRSGAVLGQAAGLGRAARISRRASGRPPVQASPWPGRTHPADRPSRAPSDTKAFAGSMVKGASAGHTSHRASQFRPFRGVRQLRSMRLGGQNRRLSNHTGRLTQLPIFGLHSASRRRRRSFPFNSVRRP